MTKKIITPITPKPKSHIDSFYNKNFLKEYFKSS